MTRPGYLANMFQQTGGFQSMLLANYLAQEHQRGEGIKSHTEVLSVIIDGQRLEMTLDQINDHLAKLSGNIPQLEAVVSWGRDPYQKVLSWIHGLPNSSHERPMIQEGPHLVLALYSYAKDGLRLYRTLQRRPFDVKIDTVRGFTGTTEEMYGNTNPDVILQHIVKTIGDEAGQKCLDIRDIVFLGAHHVNSSFVQSRTALFGIEIDRDRFLESNRVFTSEEAKRMERQYQQQGLLSQIIELTIPQFLAYGCHPDVCRDFTADAPHQAILSAHLLNLLKPSN